jgi:hypothetical protein
MAKTNERKRLVLISWNSTKKKNRNGIIKTSSYQSLWWKNWRKKKRSLRYQINEIITKKIKIKTQRIDNHQ